MKKKDLRTKICNHPKHGGDRELPIAEFYPDKQNLDGLYYMCKVCSRREAKRSRAKRAKDPQWRKRFNKLSIKYRKAGGKVTQLYRGAQGRAHRFSLEFSITKEDVVIPEVCPILGIKLETKHNSAQGSSASIDRIDNTKGYIKGNVRVISWRANCLKHDATLDEMILLGEDAKRLKSLRVS